MDFKERGEKRRGEEKTISSLLKISLHALPYQLYYH
jgi:hypothetical protein